MCQTRETYPSVAQIDKEIESLQMASRAINEARATYTRSRCKGIKATKSLVMHSFEDLLVEIGTRLRELEAAKK